MGARTIFPEFSCSGDTCTVTAPPNAHVSPPGWFQLFILDGPTPSHSAWVRIGGDPAELGKYILQLICSDNAKRTILQEIGHNSQISLPPVFDPVVC